MNPQQLSAFFAAHKVAVLGGGAVAVAALGLRQRKKTKGAPAMTTAGATIPGTIPAAAVVGGSGSSTATYDSTAFDVYDALQQQISDLAGRQQTSSPATAAAATPPPIASTLFAPLGTGNYVRYGGGTIGEVESDGSVYGIAPGENWNWSGARTSVALPWADPSQGGPAYGDKVHNLQHPGPLGNPTTLAKATS